MYLTVKSTVLYEQCQLTFVDIHLSRYLPARVDIWWTEVSVAAQPSTNGLGTWAVNKPASSDVDVWAEATDAQVCGTLGPEHILAEPPGQVQPESRWGGLRRQSLQADNWNKLIQMELYGKTNSWISKNYSCNVIYYLFVCEIFYLGYFRNFKHNIKYSYSTMTL